MKTHKQTRGVGKYIKWLAKKQLKEFERNSDKAFLIRAKVNRQLDRII